MKGEQDQSTEEIVRRWIAMDKALASPRCLSARQDEDNGLYVPGFCEKWNRERATVQKELKIFERLFNRTTEVVQVGYCDNDGHASKRFVHYYKEGQGAVFAGNLPPVVHHLLATLQNVELAEYYIGVEEADALCDEVNEIIEEHTRKPKLRHAWDQVLKRLAKAKARKTGLK